MSQNFSRGFRRKISLSKVNAVRMKRKRDVNAVVNNKTRTALASYAQSRFSRSVKIFRR